MKVIKRPIEMIAKFSQDGTPTPVKFRIINEEESWTEIKVERVTTREQEKLAGNKMLIFNCQSCLNNQSVLYQIKYEIDTCRWILHKM